MELYFIKTNEIDHDVLHIYEHIFSRKLNNEIFAKFGNYLGFYGSVNFTTFGNIITMQMYYYSNEFRELVENFLNSDMSISNDDIEREISRISAEFQSRIKYDIESLKNKLNELQKLKFMKISYFKKAITLEQNDKPAIMKFRNKRNDFSALTINFLIANDKNTPEIFLVFSRVLTDYFNSFLLLKYNMYFQYKSPIYFNQINGEWGIEFVVSAKKTILSAENFAKFKNDIKGFFNQINKITESEMSIYRNNFLNIDDLNEIFANEFEKSGILYSRNALEKSLNLENLKKIAKNIEIKYKIK